MVAILGSWNEQSLLDLSILGEPPIEIPGDQLLYKSVSCTPRFCDPHKGETSAHLGTDTTYGRRYLEALKNNFPDLKYAITI